MKARSRKKQNGPGRLRLAANASERDASAQKLLLSAARHLFARRGLSGCSIRDIAQEAGLNSSLISYYFSSKEGLYRACIEEIARTSLQMTKRVLLPANDVTEYKLRLRMFIDELFQLFLEDRDTGLILIREYDRQHSPAQDIFRDSYLQIHAAIVNFISHGQKAGYLDREKDPFTLASLLFGCFTSQMRMDHLQEQVYKKSLLDSDEKRKVENHIVDLFTIPPKNKN